MKKLAVSWSLWRYATHALCNVVASAGCYIVGFYLTDCSHPLALARSGAVATAIAIAFTLWDYREALQGGEQRAYETMKRVTDRFPLTGQTSLRDIERRLKANTRRASKAIAFVHAGALIVATLVWGFGDLAAPADCPA